MADENYSTYRWVPNTEGSVNIDRLNITEPSWWEAFINSEENIVEVDVTITHNNIFALIAGEYQVKVVGTKKGGADPIEVYCTCAISEPKLCSKESDNSYKINLMLCSEIDYSLIVGINKDEYDFSCQSDTFRINVGNYQVLNEYLYVLQKPELINLSINGKGINDTYVKGSALPINEIGNISTIDFHNITINGEQRDIFSKLEDNTTTIKTSTLDVPKLTVVDLPESEDKTIYICKSRSKNKGITFKTKDPDSSNKHFGYIIDIKGDRSAGYNSVWVNRETLNKMFIGLPADIMSNTEKFVFDNDFELHKLTYDVHDVEAPDWVNNQGQKFVGDLNQLRDYAPTYKKVTINESTGDPIRHNDMILKNIEFVKFGDKVIKLNYKPLYEA